MSCRYYLGPEGRRCAATPSRLYACGLRCERHTPAAVAGRPEDKPFHDRAPASTVEELRQHGYGLIDQGMKVFLLSATKKPLKNCPTCDTGCLTQEAKEQCDHLHCHGFYSATSDKDRFRRMLADRTDRCLAIRTGPESNVMVADYDGAEGRETMRQHIADGILPLSRTVRTGDGYHVYLRHPGGYVLSGAGKLGTKADSKADLAYVVAPPSLHKSGRRYQWIDPDVPIAEPHPDMVARLRLPERPAQPQPIALGRMPGHLAHARLKAVLTKVLDAPEGNGNNTLYWAARVAGEMVSDGDITLDQAHAALFDAALSIGITPGSAGRDPHRGTIGSGLRKGMR